MRQHRNSTRRDTRPPAILAARALSHLACLSVLACALLASAAPALAGTVTNDRPFLFSFDVEGVGTGFIGPSAIAVENSTGAVFVFDTFGDPAHGAVEKFNAQGDPQSFSALGTNVIDGGPANGAADTTPTGVFDKSFFTEDVAIDNSAANPGRIYVSETDGPVHAFDPDGSYLWTLPTETVEPCGIDVDGEGQLWVVDRTGFFANPTALEFAATGSPPAQIGSVSLTAGNAPCRPGIDQTGNNLYVGDYVNLGFPPGPLGVEKYVGGTFDSTLTSERTRDLSIDQASPVGHLFTLHHLNGKFREWDSSDSEVAGSPFGRDLIGDGSGIAYNPALDRVYVSDAASDTVKAFGPITSGPVPDPAIAPTTDLTRTSATAHGTVNPLGLNSSYRFQWKRGERQHVAVDASGGTFRLSSGGQFTEAMPFDVSPADMQAALEGLAQLGAGNVAVTGTPADGAGAPGDYDVTFIDELEASNVFQLGADGSGLSAGGKVVVTTITQGQSWGAAQSSPPQALPPDSSEHPVSSPLSGLNKNTTYQVRLVATNTDNDLSAYSAADTFTTLPPPPPTVAIDSIAPITTDSAHLEGTIDPNEDTTSWRVQTSTDPSCAGGFVDEPQQTIPNPGPGSVAVSWDLSGLLAANTYCVRIAAANAGGTTTADQVIQTLAIAPTDAATAFAAPRTDTTARLNARVNPQGEAELSYRFELSDDGASWTPLPERASTVEARDQIVVADELAGLQPETTYHYRLAAASNSAGPVAGLPGAERSFTTRTSAELTLPPNTFGEPARGIELVNNPDKGNQHVRTEIIQQTPPLSADGERAVWNVLGGAPGGNVGSGATFLAERSAAGWRSRSLIPPADQQPEGGEAGRWVLGATTPDLSAFVFSPGVPVLSTGTGGRTLLGLDADQSQLFFAQYPDPILPPRIDLTADGASGVFVVDPEPPHQLEDVSADPPLTVSLMPNGQPNQCGLDATDGNRSFVGGGNAPQAAAVQWRPGYHMIATTDASRIYFQAQPNGSSCASSLYGIYQRNRPAAQTTLIDPGAGGLSPQFIRATPDGRAAYFATASALDPADANADPDLYRWEEDSGASSCLTCVVPDADVALNTRGVLVSDDLSHFYFESRKQLVTGEGRAGDLNLYALSGGEIRFVADVNPTTGFGSLTEAQLSSDGDVLVFPASSERVSRQGLTADRLAPLCQPATPTSSPGPCRELFRYDDTNGSLECLSCRPGALTEHSFGNAGGSGQHEFALSADGDTVAFVTAERLLPLDVNASADVYEWRRGALRLVSDGLTTYPVSLFAAPQVHAVSADGADILFSLVDPGLTGFEQDGFANLYDARIGGGFTPPSPPPLCEGDACQGPLQPPPASDAPATSTAFGPANPPLVFPRRCTRPQRRVRIAKRRLRRARTSKAKRAARRKLRKARRQLRRCRGQSR